MGETKNVEEVTYSKARVNWMIFAVVFCMVIQGFGLFKLIPMQDAIQSYFHINEGAYGIMNSAQNWMMILLSVPLGYVARRVPCKWGFSIGYSISIIGMLIQIFSQNYVLFVAGRMLEGGGFGFVSLTSGALILTLVPEKRRGFWASMNVVATVLPQVIITKVGATLMVNSGLRFQEVFAIICAMYLLAIIVWLIIVPRTVRVHGVADSTKPTREQTMRVYKNASNWMVAISFIFFNAIAIGFTSYVIKFLGMKGMEMNQAANIFSYTTLIGIVAMLFFGWLSDKLGTKRKIVIVSYLSLTVSLILLAVLPANLIFIYVILYGTLPRSIAGLTTATAADIAEVPMDIPIVNSVRNTVTQIGSMLMTILMGFLIQYLGYTATIYILAAESFIGAILWFFAKRIK